MSIFFVDTSALVKRYLPEIGARWVRSWIRDSNRHGVFISELARVEVYTVLARVEREGRLTQEDGTNVRHLFNVHLRSQYLTVPLERATLLLAQKLTSKHPIRSLDSIQLACTLRCIELVDEPIIFVSGDNRLLEAAAVEGFATDNPYLHPE